MRVRLEIPVEIKVYAHQLKRDLHLDDVHDAYKILLEAGRTMLLDTIKEERMNNAGRPMKKRAISFTYKLQRDENSEMD
jgi:hypothetical protein